MKIIIKYALTQKLVTTVIGLCKQKGIVTTADPKRKNFFSYSGVDIFKPNLKEVKEALNLLVEEVTLVTLQNIHRLLAEKLNHHISFITLSEKGVFCQDENMSETQSPPMSVIFQMYRGARRYGNRRGIPGLCRYKRC